MHGVVEGFYGRPFSPEMRSVIFRVLSGLPEPVYLYAPKDDPFHRKEWRRPYPSREWRGITDSIGSASRSGVRFYFGLSPWRFEEDEAPLAREKLAAAAEAGAGGLCLLFDDVPQTPTGDLAERQLAFASKALEGLELPVMLCPSVYCHEHLRHIPGASGYLEEWRRGFKAGWDVLWTGPEVVSRELARMDEASRCLGRTPVVWDNLLADDYCLRRVFLGSLRGRAVPETRLLLNPSRIFPVALHGVMELVGALGGRREWPPELGPRVPGWAMLRDFNYTPWEVTGEAEEVIGKIRSAIRGDDPGETLTWLDSAGDALEELADRLAAVPGGWGLHPVVRDMIRTLSILKKALGEEDPSSRAGMLHYLMHRRLPCENPLAALASNPLEEPCESSSCRLQHRS